LKQDYRETERRERSSTSKTIAIQIPGIAMTKVRRLAAVGALLAFIAWLSSPDTQGEPGKKPVADPVVRPAKAPAPTPEAALAEPKFNQGGVQTYTTLQGENLFALQIKPKLEPAPVRNRDILIMVSVAASQAGDWIAAHQIADGFFQTANKGDQIALW